MVASEHSSDLSLDVRTTIDDDRITVRVRGDIDLLTAPTLTTHVGEAVDHHPTSLVLDWTGVSFLDSSGLRALLQIQRACDAAGIDLIIQPSDPVMRVLRAVGIDSLLTPTRSPTGVRLRRQPS